TPMPLGERVVKVRVRHQERAWQRFKIVHSILVFWREPVMNKSPLRIVAACLAAVAAFAAAPAHAGKTLDGIKSRGQVVCGVNTGLAGFSAADSNGKWSGLD